MASREERLARNEIVFREVNERIAELSDTWGGGLDLVCECANFACVSVLHISVREYELLRQNSRRFAVLPGHELPDIETVVESRNDYLVVEKHEETHEQVERADARTPN